MAKPFNLDAVATEAAGEPFQFTFGGNTYTLPVEPDLVTARLLQKGQVADALGRLLGPEQWDSLVESDEVFTLSHLEALFGAYGEHLGIDMGESPASSSSSKGTARPSKRTSRTGTK